MLGIELGVPGNGFPRSECSNQPLQPLGVPSTGDDTETTPEQGGPVDVVGDPYLACEGDLDLTSECWPIDGCHRRHSELYYPGVGKWVIRTPGRVLERHRRGFSWQWVGVVRTHEGWMCRKQRFIGVFRELVRKCALCIRFIQYDAIRAWNALSVLHVNLRVLASLVTDMVNRTMEPGG